MSQSAFHGNVGGKNNGENLQDLTHNGWQFQVVTELKIVMGHWGPKLLEIRAVVD